MNHPTELPREPNGNSGEASWLKKILKCVRERTFIAGKGIKLEHKTNGTVIHATAEGARGGAGTGAVTTFRVKGQSGDYLSCVTYNETTLIEGNETIRVAKPWRLRQTPWNGLTFTYDFTDIGAGVATVYYVYSSPGFRTATITNVNPNSVERQAITPLYSINDILYATQPDTFPIFSGEAALPWLDLNVDAREWARY